MMFLYFFPPFPVFTSIYVSLIYCRDQLKRNYNLGQYYLDVSLDDLRNYDERLADKLLKSPTEYVPVVMIKFHYNHLKSFSKLLKYNLFLLSFSLDVDFG